jgi:predicted nucleic acid-binding protein
MITYVLDACALITLFKLEPGEDIVEDLFQKAKNQEASLCMSVINLIEVYYGFMNDEGVVRAKEVLTPVKKTPLKIIDTVSQPVYETAARLKSTYKCSLADAVGLATAVELSGYFVTSDHHELKKVENGEQIPFLWLPPRPRK